MTDPYDRGEDTHLVFAVAHLVAAIYGDLADRRYHLRAFSQYAATYERPGPVVEGFAGP